MKPDLDAIRAHYAGETAAPPRAMRDVRALLAYIDELEGRGFLPPVNAEHEAIVDGMLAKAREGVAKRPIERDAYRRGAEAMREQMMSWLARAQAEATVIVVDTAIRGVHKLPIPEDNS